MSNPSKLTPYLKKGESSVQFILPIQVTFKVEAHQGPGVFDQAQANVSFSASTAGDSKGGNAGQTNSDYDAKGVLANGGDGSLMITISTNGSDAIEIPFSVGVDAMAQDVFHNQKAKAEIEATFSPLTDSSGNSLPPDLGVEFLPKQGPKDDHTKPGDHKPKDDGNGCGMATYNFHTMLASLLIIDTPVGYEPPYGVSMPFTVTYTQRGTSQSSVFDSSNFGPKWNCNWFGYLIDDAVDSTAVSRWVTPGGGSSPIRYIGTANGYQTFQIVGQPAKQLRRAVANPLPLEVISSDGSKEIYGRSDGKTSGPRKVFLTQRIDSAGNATTLTYDTKLRVAKITDPLAQDTVFSYGLAGDPLKVTKITDPFGRFAKFAYDGSKRLVKITDVIGLESKFTYQGKTGFINSLITPYGTTKFTNTEDGFRRRIMATDPNGDSEVVESNSFDTPSVGSYEALDSVPQGMALFNAELGSRNSFYWDKKRWKEAPNDYAKAHIYHWLREADYSSISGTLESEKPPLEARIWYNYPGQSKPEVVGSQLTPSRTGRFIENGTQLTSWAYNSLNNPKSATDPLRRKTTYEYEPNGIDLHSITNRGATGSFSVNAGGGTAGAFDNDFGYSASSPYGVASTINLNGVSSPAPQEVYQTGRYGSDFAYSFSSLAVGTTYQLRLHFAELYFNAAGQRVFDVQINGNIVLSDFDVFVAAGNSLNKGVIREFNAAPDSTGKIAIRFIAKTDNAVVSGFEVINPNPAPAYILQSYTWNTQHRPLTSTDAAGNVTHYTWKPTGQLESVTNAKSETTVFNYYPANATGKQRKGRLHQIDGALAGDSDIVTFDYDAAGSVASVTGPDGYALTFTHDALDRLTRTTFPDATYTETIYKALDPFRSRDRLGRITKYVYNSIRQLTSVTDPLKRTVQYEWCKCGDLKQLIDALGRPTTWYHDIAGRVSAKRYADGSTITYNYQPLSGRLDSIIDEKGQVKTRSYKLDDTLAGLTYTNAEHTTPNVTFTYETDFRRLKTMLDGIGTTTYAYNPIVPGTPGAGRLASVDGPLPDDTLTYAYDELMRNTGYAINGVGEMRDFDSLGRLLTAVNPLGTFGYTYVGATSRMDKVTYPNGMTCQYNYHPLKPAASGGSGDFRLKDIIHTLPGNTQLSRHSYAYNPVGDITRWTQISPQAGLRRSWLCGYDAADQLTSVASQDPDTLAALPTGQYGYSYDLAGNRLTETIDGVTATASFNALNQLTSLTTAGSSTLPQQTYEWDAEDRLSAINYTGTNERSEFEYDAFGRRRGLREKQGPTLIVYRRFAWADLQMTEERDSTGSGVQKRYFARGLQFKGTGTALMSRLFASDHLGSVRGIVSSASDLAMSQDFDPWGRRTITAGTDESNLAFTGHWLHSKSDLVMAAFRQYETKTGRWLSRDPINETGGANLYSYVKNSPAVAIDSLGLILQICGDDDFRKTVKDDLDWIKRSDPRLRKMIEDLEQSDNLHKIVARDWLHDLLGHDNANRSSFLGLSRGTITKYNPYDPFLDVDPVNVLVHELKHAYDRDRGVFDDSPNPSTGNKLSEDLAVGTENMMRSHTGDPGRLKY